MSRTTVQILVVFTAALLLAQVSSQAVEHSVKPGDSPQAALDRAAPGDRLVFLPGLHQHRLGKHRSLLYVDKSVEIELQAGATLSSTLGRSIPTAAAICWAIRRIAAI
jgi:hypothetical protein